MQCKQKVRVLEISHVWSTYEILVGKDRKIARKSKCGIQLLLKIIVGILVPGQVEEKQTFHPSI